jgi:DNA-binding response OmpR family regulator
MKNLKRLLYAEDEPDIRAVAQIALQHIGGFELLTCDSGEQAVREAQAFAPDMVLLDVMMPGMDGPGTLRALRAMPGLEDVPVAFMTAKVQPNEVAQFVAMGAVDVIAKPFDPMTLADQVRALWERHHG